jgi:hypothetical protein
MNDDLRKFALRLKVIEILGHYAEARRQLHVLRTWKKLLITPN